MLKMLDSVQNSAIRICTGAFRTSPMESIYAESGAPTLTLRREYLTIKRLSHLKVDIRHPICTKLFEENTETRGFKDIDTSTFKRINYDTLVKLHMDLNIIRYKYNLIAEKRFNENEFYYMIVS